MKNVLEGLLPLGIILATNFKQYIMFKIIISTNKITNKHYLIICVIELYFT
jgi:hypothetical protein